MRAHGFDDVTRDLALVERVGAPGRDARERRRERRVLQRLPNGERRAVRVEEVGARPLLDQVLLAGNRDVQTWAHGEPVLGQLDGRLEELGPRQSPVLTMGELEQAQRSWNTDRLAPDHCVIELQRFAVRAEKAVWFRSRRSGLAAIVRGEQPGAAVVKEHERTAADARGLRLDEIEHHLHRDGCVHRAAALAEDLEARLDRERVRRGNHVALAEDGLFRRPAGGKLGRLVLRPRAGGDQEQEKAEEEWTLH